MYNKKKGKYEELIAENDKKWEQYAEDTLECAGILYKSIEQHINNKDITTQITINGNINNKINQKYINNQFQDIHKEIINNRYIKIKVNNKIINLLIFQINNQLADLDHKHNINHNYNLKKRNISIKVN